MNDYKLITRMKGGEDLGSMKESSGPVRTNGIVEVDGYLPNKNINVKERISKMDNQSMNESVSHEMAQNQVTLKVGESVMNEMNVNLPNANEGTPNHGGSMTTPNSPQQDEETSTSNNLNEKETIMSTEEKKKRTPYDGSTSHGVNVGKLDNIESVIKATKRLRLCWNYLKNQYKAEGEIVVNTENGVDRRIEAMNNAEAIKTKMEELQNFKAEVDRKSSELKEKALNDIQNFDPSAIDIMVF